MTADDIISANPEVEYRPAEFEGRPGLIGKRADGTEFWTIWEGNANVACEMPYDPVSFRIAVTALEDGQPGKEFNTVWGDKYAAQLRRIGIIDVGRNEHGDPTVARNTASVAAKDPQAVE